MGFKLPKVGLELKKIDSSLDSTRKALQEFKNKNVYSKSFNKEITKNVKNIAGNTFLNSGEKKNPYFRSRYRTNNDENLIGTDGVFTNLGRERYDNYMYRDVDKDGKIGNYNQEKLREDLVENRQLDPKSGKIMTYVAPPADGYKGLEEQARLSADMSFGLSDKLRRYNSNNELLSVDPETVKQSLSGAKKTLSDIAGVGQHGSKVYGLSEDQLELYGAADEKAQSQALIQKEFDNMAQRVRDMTQDVSRKNLLGDEREGGQINIDERFGNVVKEGSSFMLKGSTAYEQKNKTKKQTK